LQEAAAEVVMRHFVLGGLLVGWLVACGGDETGGGGEVDVSGEWDATEGEQGYLRLDQSGDEITGIACESEGQDCYDLVDAKLTGRRLTFSYSFAEEDGEGEATVEADLTLDGAGDAMSGHLTSSKCDCEIPHAYARR
jgi:hypothetical protein